MHVGGTDFDYRLSVAEVMPLLGLGSLMRLSNGSTVPMPALPFHELATWHRIVFLYNRKMQTELGTLRRDALQPELIARFQDIIEYQYGHLLAAKVEDAKVALSDADTSPISLDFLEEGLFSSARRAKFQTSIERELGGISRAIAECLELGGVTAEEVSALFLTGGSTAVPAVYQACTEAAPGAKVVEGDKFGSVGLGLALDAAARYR